MGGEGFFRRLRGAVGTAVVWGAGWFTAFLGLLGTAKITGVVFESLTWSGVLGFSLRAGVIGGVSGAAFSTVIGLLYRGRRLSEISWLRFGVLGGVATAIFVPLFLQTMNLISGDGLVSWRLVLDDAVLTGVLGTVVAGGSIKLAQAADARLPGGVEDPSDQIGSGR